MLYNCITWLPHGPLSPTSPLGPKGPASPLCPCLPSSPISPLLPGGPWGLECHLYTDSFVLIVSLLHHVFENHCLCSKKINTCAMHAYGQLGYVRMCSSYVYTYVTFSYM